MRTMKIKEKMKMRMIWARDMVIDEYTYTMLMVGNRMSMKSYKKYIRYAEKPSYRINKSLGIGGIRSCRFKF